MHTTRISGYASGALKLRQWAGVRAAQPPGGERAKEEESQYLQSIYSFLTLY